MDYFSKVMYERWNESNFVHLCDKCGESIRYLEITDTQAEEWYDKHDVKGNY